MSLNFFRDLLQLLIVFIVGYGVCYYSEVVPMRSASAARGVSQECVPLYNYCISLEKTCQLYRGGKNE